jgi:hypothetical protein
MSIVTTATSIQSAAIFSEGQVPSPPRVMRAPPLCAPPIRPLRFLRYLGDSRFYRIADGSDSVTLGEECSLDFLNTNYQISFGSSMLHGELIFSVPDFSESPYAKPMPWNDTYNSNWNIELKPFGKFRSFFMNGPIGNYENFYDMFSIFSASPFYNSCKIPQFYSEAGNCTETTYSHKIRPDDYHDYRPFAVENSSYSRSYFYGMNY